MNMTAAPLKIVSRLAGTGAWYWDFTSNEVSYDDPGRRIFRLNQSELPLGVEEWFALIDPTDVGRVSSDVFKACNSSGSYEGTYRIVRRDGTLGYIREIGQICEDHDGAPVGMVGVTRDITSRVELEAALNQKIRLEAVGKVASGIAHDLNNMLAVIEGNLDLAAVDLSSPDVGEFVSTAMMATAKSASLTQKLQRFAIQRPFTLETVDAVTLVRDLIPFLKSALGGHITLKCNLDTKNGHCRVDRNFLETVLVNLTVNARDAMPDGGELTLRIRKLALAAARRLIADDGGFFDAQTEDTRFVVISVSDSGSGMDEDTRARVFNPYFTTKEPGEGTGLGLYLAKCFVQQVEGHISLQSRVGIGTTVHIFLPLCP